MNAPSRLKTFLWPRPTIAFFIRTTAVALAAYLVFSYVLVPFRIKGHSMQPTYRDGQVNFCFRWRYLFNAPGKQDIVVIRLAGKKVMLLKRVVATAGDRVGFRDGRLMVNGQGVIEPYVRYSSDWNLSPRTVAAGSVYVVGDNRNIAIERHQFGQTNLDRVMGAPLW
jgi:signal peptidase I